MDWYLPPTVPSHQPPAHRHTTDNKPKSPSSKTIPMNDFVEKPTAFNAKYESDRRQFGGMLMITGFCSIVQPLANIASSIGPGGAYLRNPSEIGIFEIIGAFSLFINGVFALAIGYMACVHDTSSQVATGFLIVMIQTAFIPYVTDMIAVAEIASSDPANQGFVPYAYGPTPADVRFVGAMGVVAIFAYGFAFVGSVSFMAFCLHAYNTGNYETRTADYFRGRLGFYCGMLTVAGMTQFFLGVYVNTNFGSGMLQGGPIRAAMLIVVYPGAAVFLGLMQIINGAWGMVRSYGIHAGPNDWVFQLSMLVQWVLVLSLQDIMQVAYLPVGMLAPAAPTLAAVSFGINMMPAYLDHKMRNSPESFPEHYYDAVEPSEVLRLEDIVDEEYEVYEDWPSR